MNNKNLQDIFLFFASITYIQLTPLPSVKKQQTWKDKTSHKHITRYSYIINFLDLIQRPTFISCSPIVVIFHAWGHHKIGMGFG